MSDIQDASNCKPKDRRTLRNAETADLPELMRLLCSQQAQTGHLPDVDIPKCERTFEAGIANRELMLVVAPGARGRLNGFLLIGLVEPWFSARPSLSELCFCVDHGHLRSKSVRELRKFAAWARSQMGSHKRDDAAAQANSLPQSQNCTATTLPPAPTDNPENAPDAKAPDEDLSCVMHLLERLAQHNRPSLSGTNEGAPMPRPGVAQAHPMQKNGGG